MSLGMTLFIAIVVIGNIVGCLWLIRATSKRKAGEVEEGEVKSHVWDDDLREYNNPLPRWWLNLFLITIVFAAIYLALFPGLGSFQGYASWSSSEQLQEQLAGYHAQRDAFFGRFAGQDIAVLADSPDARRVGEAIFGRNCAGCHGTQALGAVGYPNLADDSWIYGGSPDQIEASIVHGRAGVMPAFNGQLSAEQLDALITLLEDWPDDASDSAGYALFQTRCAACHGTGGLGNTAIGAPNLADDVWLWGGDREAIRYSILFGRQNNMPAHDALISDDEIRLVTAWVYGLSKHTR